MQLELAQDRKLTLRPSGTEPKLKIYLEACEPPAAREELDESRARATAALDALEREVGGLLEAE